MTKPIPSSTTNFSFTAIPKEKSTNSCSITAKIRHFLSDPNDAPPYGYQDNKITGIGFWLMQGARFSISMYDRGANPASCLEKTVQKSAAVFFALLTLPFTLVGALMKGIGSRCPHKVLNLTSEQIRKTPAHKIDQIYDLLQIVNALLREHRIDYAMDGGTLLGAIRHKGIIEWDDDADVVVMHRDKERLLTLTPRLKEKGIVVQDGGLEALKLTFDAATLKQRYGVPEKEAANLDIFFMEEEADGKIRPKADFYKHQFPKEFFSREELQQLCEYPFGPPEKGLVLKGPAQPMRYLTTFYGPECFEYALQTHSHIQLGPMSFPLLNFSKTRYKIVNPTYAQGNHWKTTVPLGHS
jgi:lipopolysaccharide cholinephosphotransferase